MATSFGLVQWNFGSGTLATLLNKMRASDPATFDACFTADSNYDALKTSLVLGKKGKAAQGAWARKLCSTADGKKAWKTSFENIGSVDSFNKIQFNTAIDDFNPTVENDIKYLRTFAPALIGKVEFRSYAALFDCAIQQGGLQRAADEIKAKVLSDKPKTQFAPDDDRLHGARQVALLDRSQAAAGWLKVRYVGRSGKAIERWVRAEDLDAAVPAH
jgi:hypothetical protein